ncbi:uncharacterized protein A4U43_C03F17630 [Asparagus officinalis]|uniref:STAS domain-containing protein n=1 Tax=Asparagus officinalis TaxID=4686 RepID=A0A5P1FAW2_ASPOF|nr:low affinity sulfate transporter 3 [Asparagus officinalis]ONK75508.1 uncharacterized protein A4U43_C03F17630 [Asparagus officinalis]
MTSQSSATQLNGKPEMASFSVLSAEEPPSLWTELTSTIKTAVSPCGSKPNYSILQCTASAFKGLFPILNWGRKYDLKSFRRDLLAGLTIASLGIPQSIGYANLAKLDPQYGLYTSVVPPLIYAVMGSSNELAIGPVAAISLLLSSMIQKVVDPSVDPTTYTKIAFTATFFAGIFQSAFGLLRLGFLVDFLSHAAIVGFMGGAAVVIGFQQLKGLLGISHFTNNTDVVSVSKAVISALHESWHPENFFLGCSFLIFIMITRFIGRKNRKLFWLPAIAPLISVVLSTSIVFLTKADKHGVKTIQHVKGGLNQSSVSQLQLNGLYAGESAKIGLICAIVALAEAIAAGRSFAAIRGYQLDGNKEMMAMGFMNIAGSLSSCYVATGSFSRSAVNFSAGCKTPISNVVMAITVFLSLEFLTRLLYYTPYSILASIIISALPNLIDVSEAYHIWEVDKMDFLACIGAFLGVLFGSVEIGLVVAMVISFARILLSSIRSRIEILGRIPGTDIFCSTRHYTMATRTHALLVARIDTSFLCFTNANFIRERITRAIKEEGSIEEKGEERIHSLVIDMSNVMNMDTSGIAALEEIYKNLASIGIQVAIANPGLQAVHKMKLSKFVERIGEQWIFLTVSEAVEACLDFRKSNAC